MTEEQKERRYTYEYDPDGWDKEYTTRNTIYTTDKDPEGLAYDEACRNWYDHACPNPYLVKVEEWDKENKQWVEIDRD